MRDGQLLEKEQIDKIRNIPATIVQGRYDCVCPAKTAWDLHKGAFGADVDEMLDISNALIYSMARSQAGHLLDIRP